MTKTVLLGDICDVRDGTHDSPKPRSSGYPLVTSKHLKQGKVDVSSANLISEQDYFSINKRSRVDKYDVLIGMIGTVGELAFIDYDPHFAIKNVGLIKSGNELLGRYLFYYLQSAYAKRHLQAVLAGSTQRFISLGELRRFPITLLEEPGRKKVVDILRVIDAKIELNRRMNETLEHIGQTLFHKYFSSNGAGTHKKLGEVLELHYGKALTAKDREVGSYPVYGSSGVVGYHNKPMIEAPGIIVGRKGNVGSVFWAQDDFYPIDTVFYVASSLPLSLMYFYLKKAKFINSDAAVPGLNRNQVYNLDFAYPDKETVEQIAPKLSSLLEMQRTNSLANKNLVKLRDSLLPRLISGELKV